MSSLEYTKIPNYAIYLGNFFKKTARGLSPWPLLLFRKHPLNRFLQILIPEIPVVDSLTFMVGQLYAAFLQEIPKSPILFQQKIFCSAGHIDGLNRITFFQTLFYQILRIGMTGLQLIQISEYFVVLVIIRHLVGSSLFHAHNIMNDQSRRKAKHFAEGIRISQRRMNSAKASHGQTANIGIFLLI